MKCFGIKGFTPGLQPCKARGELLQGRTLQPSRDRTGNQWSLQCRGWGEASGTQRLSVTMIHLELHGAQTHCHRKRLSETSVCLQQQRHGQKKKTGEWEREREKSWHADTYTRHSYTHTHTKLSQALISCYKEDWRVTYQLIHCTLFKASVGLS